MEITKVTYHQWNNCYQIANEKYEMIAVADVGPRILKFGFRGGMNQFAEFPEDRSQIGNDRWKLYGGHRLWHSPEDLERTYYPDDEPVQAAINHDSLVLTQNEEVTTKVRKTIEIKIDAATGEIRIRHSIKNCGLWSIKLAAWGISAMAPGGISIVRTRSQHSENICTPNLRICFWPHSLVDDCRLKLTNQFVLLKQDAAVARSFKLGISGAAGWVAYWRDADLFVKYFNYCADGEYPDFGSSVELYTNDRFAEIETLSPLCSLEPGQEVRHSEKWQLFKMDRNAAAGLDEAYLNDHVIPLIMRTAEANRA